MKTFFNSLTSACVYSAALCLLAFILLPLKLVIVLAVNYYIAHALGLFKFKFPDVWELEENHGDLEKSHKIFLSIPTRINGRFYLFCYVNRVIIDGETTYSLEPIADTIETTD